MPIRCSCNLDPDSSRAQAKTTPEQLSKVSACKVGVLTGCRWPGSTGNPGSNTVGAHHAEARWLAGKWACFWDPKMV